MWQCSSRKAARSRRSRRYSTRVRAAKLRAAMCVVSYCASASAKRGAGCEASGSIAWASGRRSIGGGGDFHGEIPGAGDDLEGDTGVGREELEAAEAGDRAMAD